MSGKNYKNGYIKIDDNKISAIGNTSDLGEISDDCINANGGYVLPGFIDAHTHLGVITDSVGFEGDDLNEETDPVTPHLRAIDSINSFDRCINEAAYAGVTTVLTGPGSANVIGGQISAIKTISGMVDEQIIDMFVGMKFALGENPKCTYNEKSQTPITRMGAVALIREQLEKAKRYMQDKQKAIEEDEDLPDYDMKCEALIPIIKREKKAFFHAHRADDIFTAIRIAKEFKLDYVLVHATEGHLIANKLKEINPNIITGPIIGDRSKPELRNSEIYNSEVLINNGINLAICTDHPEVPIQYLALSSALALKNKIPFEDVLKCITINAAKISGIDNKVGSIEVGKDADIIIFNDNPLEVSAYPQYVIINGNIVKQ